VQVWTRVTASRVLSALAALFAFFSFALFLVHTVFLVFTFALTVVFAAGALIARLVPQPTPLRSARIASVTTAALGITTGLLILFAPTGAGCSVEVTMTPGQPASALTTTHCATTNMVLRQPVWPMPLLAIAAWSLAPLLAVAGVWWRRPWLVVAAFVVEATTVISAAAVLYLPLVLVPLAITLLLTVRSLRPVTPIAP
jgi:hypothetical protein